MSECFCVVCYPLQGTDSGGDGDGGDGGDGDGGDGDGGDGGDSSASVLMTSIGVLLFAML